MSPFLRQVRTSSGAIAVQIVVKEGRRNKVVEHLGSAHDEAELARLYQIGQEKLHPGQLELDLAPARGVVTSKFSRLLWETLCGAYTDLGFDRIGDEAFKQVVLARLIQPASKAATVQIIEELGVEAVSLRTVFTSLERCQGRDYRGQIAGACFAYAQKTGDVSLVLYDVTTLYFEAEKEDELRRVGYSKERRVDPQIVVGLLVDRTGFPLEIGCFEGNTAETGTLIPIITQFQERHQIDHIVVVADAGMMSTTNLAGLDEAGLGFIVGARQTKAPGDLATHLDLDVSHSFADGQIIDTLTPKGRGKRTWSGERPLWDPATHTGAWRAIWAYSARRSRRDLLTLDAQEAKARAVIDETRKTKSLRFITTSKTGQSFDEASLRRARSIAGWKGYLTNLPVSLMTGGEIVAKYHDLWHVEQSFRMSKTDLRARPIFHHKHEAIEAHLTIVFAALAIARYIQNASGASIKHVISTLKPIQDITVTINDTTYTATDPITENANTILTHLATTLGH